MLGNVFAHFSDMPLLWLTVTLGAYYLATVLYEKLGMTPFAHPLLTAMVIIVPFLMLTDTPYETYFEGAQFVHFMLGPATVALAIPLYLYAAQVKQMLLPLGIALVVGCITAIIVVVAIGNVLGLSELTLRSLAPKSATTPIAMPVAEQIGGIPSLTAVLVILTGIIGGVFGKEVLDLLRVHHDSARGFAMGLAAHGVGTARAFQMSEQAGAFAGLAMGLNGTATALFVPLLAQFLL